MSDDGDRDGDAGPARPMLRVTRSFSVPLDELSYRFSASGGPGGQHANTSNTKVEVRFDIAGSPSLDEVRRARLIAHYGPELRVVASGERSQGRNRAEALERLAARLAAGLHVERTRVPTRATNSSKRRRLDDKARRSQVKQARRRPDHRD